MVGRTVRVTPENGRWAVRRNGGKSAAFTFIGKSDAVAAAKALARDTQPSQLIIQGRDGRIQEEHVFGLPKIQRLPYKSRISATQIERAVLKVSDMLGD